jgi:hypothetical protein
VFVTGRGSAAREEGITCLSRQPHAGGLTRRCGRRARARRPVRMMVGTDAGSSAAVDRDPGVSPTFAVGWLRLLDSNQRPGG